MPHTIRPATETDQHAIVALVHSVGINPRNLHWSHFLVAEADGRLVGIRQVKVHKKGTREVASGAVLPDYRRHGISRQLMETILACETGDLYLMCDEKWSPYYEGFDFRRVGTSELPADFKQEYWISKIITTIISIVTPRKLRIIPMKRDTHPPSL